MDRIGTGRTEQLDVVTIVPQIEKKAAHRGLARWARSEAFADAWSAKQVPAPTAARIQTTSIVISLRRGGEASKKAPSAAAQYDARRRGVDRMVRGRG